MAHQDEIELKFELDSDAADRVRTHPLLAKADRRDWFQRTTYFDTEDGKLRNEGYTLRVRQIDDRFTQTVKTSSRSAGLFERQEWESAVRGMKPDCSALEDTPLARLNYLGRLEPVSRFAVKRTSWTVNIDRSSIEVVLDSGRFSAARRKAPLHELEIELKKGNPRAIFTLARKLSNAARLEIGVLSKDERGFLLARNMLGNEQKASASTVQRDMDIGEAVVLFVHECVRQLRLSQPAIVTRRDPDALHQARLAIRRLRSLFSFFRPAIPRNTLDPLRTQLRSFIEPFGQARNLDVFLARHGKELPSDDRRKLSRARGNAYGEVIEAMESQRSRDLFLDLIEWASTRRRAKSGVTDSLENFAGKQLDTMWEKIKRKSSMLPFLEENEIHRLRIAIKKMRYALEFMAGLYSAKKVGKFTEGLGNIQDCLGELHDDMFERQLIDTMSLDLVLRAEGAGRSRALERAQAHFRRLRKLDRVWSG
ncbi:MAG TPA: CHAD domain-containing protein [Allosphingosinicella sp.]